MRKKIRMIAVASAIAVAIAVSVFAAYDSTKDPIVSLSYLSQVFKPKVKGELKSELKGELKGELSADLGADMSAMKESIKAELEAELKEKIDSDYSQTIDALQAELDALSNVYETVTLEKGKRLTANAACEIVLLSGSATVRSSAADSGIIDCTDGVILYDGQSVPANHKLLVPDNGDGRGVSATGKTELLVKGGYTVG